MDGWLGGGAAVGMALQVESELLMSTSLRLGQYDYSNSCSSGDFPSRVGVLPLEPAMIPV